MTATVKRVAKRLVAQGVVRSGWWEVASRAWARRGTTFVLTYHRVLEKWEPLPDYSQPGMVVTRATFERQLSFLERRFDIVPLGALLDDAAATPTRRPRCVITFDDGWRDNYELAFPLIRKHNLPATIFLTTDFIGTERAFWHTELIYLLLNCPRAVAEAAERSALPPALQEKLRACAAAGGVSGAAAVDALIERLKAACDEPVIAELVETFLRTAGLRRPLVPERRFFLDWNQVRDMAAHGFEIGSHGCTHRIMTRLSHDEARREFVQSKAEIESQVGRTVEHFAFPNEDADQMLVTMAGQAGYRTVCVGRLEGEAGPRLRTLRRAGMHEGACLDGTTYDDAMLGLCLLRGPKSVSR